MLEAKAFCGIPLPAQLVVYESNKDKKAGKTLPASGCRKTMLQKKDNRAAGELEGAKAPLEIGLIAIKNA